MPTNSLQELLRTLPQVDEVLHDARLAHVREELPHAFLVSFIRDSIEEAREKILGGLSVDTHLSAFTHTVIARAQSTRKNSLTRVVNASGVVIHTNLGRSALAQEAVEAVTQVAGHYSTLEYDTQTRARGSRHDHYENLLCALTGAEAACAVNNNAAAVLMILSEFSAHKEALVSRGELVEIGGSFRVPDIMELSHAHMKEVGTTNKTHLSDYEKALTEQTALLLKVHPSNYRMIGFTESVTISELRNLADKEKVRREERSYNTASHDSASAPLAQDLLVYEDQGSGALIHLDSFGTYAEPTVAESLKQGCDLVSFSGDKLLGGPQAGLIVGAKKYIDRLKKNPLARALRLDKMTLAALEATLKLYFSEQEALHKIPTLRMLSAPAEEVRQAAEALQALLEKTLPSDHAHITLIPEISRAGGGSLPMCDIDTYAVCVEFLRGTAQNCETYLISNQDIPIIARIKHDRMLFDARTLLNDEEFSLIAHALTAYFDTVNPSTTNSQP